jgi:hypothetical protein
MQIPFDLPEHSRVMVAGAGGGFDVICALPVALKLKELGHEVHLANYSFTNLSAVRAADTSVKDLFCIGSQSRLSSGDYFPELELCRWWEKTYDQPQNVWCYSLVGVRPLTRMFQYLETALKLDAIVVLDGGVDGLFIGNEYDLATPSMDAISIIAASTLKHCKKVYAFTAFGTEGAESKVRHADALLRISELIAQDGFIGVTALTRNSAIGKLFIEALDFVHKSLPPEKHSVIAGSIVAAMRGNFGYTSFNVKTQTSQVWLSALTLLYWFCELDSVADAKSYIKEVMDTDSVSDVADAIERTRARMGILPKADIPI